MTRDELIAALERATGPDTDLDMGCWAITNGMEFERRPDGRIRALVERCYCTGLEPHPHWVGYGEKERPHSHPYPDDNSIWGVPLYTGSIDDALTLVPDGAPWLLFRYENGQMFAECGGDDPQQYTGATPAIALCIASLKARETDHE